jgi:hypothetical protein
VHPCCIITCGHFWRAFKPANYTFLQWNQYLAYIQIIKGNCVKSVKTLEKICEKFNQEAGLLVTVEAFLATGSSFFILLVKDKTRYFPLLCRNLTQEG